MKNPGTEFVPKSAEEERKEKRKRKWELIAGAVGDGMSAVSNLIFASLGAPSGEITTTGKGKSSNKSLIEAIKGKHAAHDAEYGKKLSAWEKEEEKKRKDAEKLAKENDRVEDIHPDFQPKFKNWQTKDYIDVLYADLRGSLRDHSMKRAGLDPEDPNSEWETKDTNDKLGVRMRKNYAHPTLDWLDRWETDGNVGKYMKASLIQQILSGEYKNDELTDEFLTTFRKKAQENDDNWYEIK